MRKLLTLILLVTMTTFSQAQSVFDFTLPTITGQEQSLSDYQGQVILIVNVASRCGLTPQYADLQELYEKYQDRGLVILGFPANNFMGQEPGTNQEIASFCENRYGVTFPMFSKISVKGSDRHPLYAYLENATGEQPGWNFHKYLIDRDGEQVVSLSSRTRVNEPNVIDQIEALLGEEE